MHFCASLLVTAACLLTEAAAQDAWDVHQNGRESFGPGNGFPDRGGGPDGKGGPFAEKCNPAHLRVSPELRLWSMCRRDYPKGNKYYGEWVWGELDLGKCLANDHGKVTGRKEYVFPFVCLFLFSLNLLCSL